MIEEFVTALVTRPFGLEGFVKIRSLSGATGHLREQKSFVVRKDGARAEYRVESVRPAHGDTLYLKLAGVDTPEAAKALNGAELLVPRARAAALAKDEFYIEDLRGLRVEDGAGAVVGRIDTLIEGGGGFLVRVALAAGGTRLVPFRHEFFGDVSAARGRAVLTQPWILE